MSWLDPAFIARGLHPGDQRALAAVFSGPITEGLDEYIGHPPIHQHHTHLVHGPTDVHLNGLGDWQHNRVYMYHGDCERDTRYHAHTR